MQGRRVGADVDAASGAADAVGGIDAAADWMACAVGGTDADVGWTTTAAVEERVEERVDESEKMAAAVGRDAVGEIAPAVVEPNAVAGSTVVGAIPASLPLEPSSLDGELEFALQAHYDFGKTSFVHSIVLVDGAFRSSW